jgi:xylan 1,4-beta-xylosidase
VSRLTFFCDLAETTTPLPHFWEHTVGSDHAPMALRDDWQRDLKRAHDELGFRHVRFHGLLSDGMGIVVAKNDNSFTKVDRVFDFLLSIGVRPFVELSFMPTALASGDKTVFHYKANVTPPKNYKEWARLIEQLVSHLVERYGESQVGMSPI